MIVMIFLTQNKLLKRSRNFRPSPSILPVMFVVVGGGGGVVSYVRCGEWVDSYGRCGEWVVSYGCCGESSSQLWSLW